MPEYHSSNNLLFQTLVVPIHIEFVTFLSEKIALFKKLCDAKRRIRVAIDVIFPLSKLE
jgi:hypothetical protein